MQKFKQMLWWLIGGTRGGKNRMRLIMQLDEKPMNANQLSEELDLDYKTVTYHLDLMEEQNVITSGDEGYGKQYFLTDKMEQNMNQLKHIAQKAGVENES